MSNNDLEKRLWSAADQLRANSSLTAQEYSRPVLGLIFLKYADYRFSQAELELQSEGDVTESLVKLKYQAKGVLYLPEKTRFSYLIQLTEGSDIGRAINEAMEAIEKENEDIRGVLPRDYQRLENSLLVELLKIFNSIPFDIEGDVFGKIYEYFLSKFAMTEGRGGGEFYTPTSIVRLIVNIIEPYHGRIYDPACGSGGMFVQSARFVEEHKHSATKELSIYGQESKDSTARLCRMNLAVHGLPTEGIKQGNTYYEDRHNSLGRFDFVMANPPFNVNGVDKERIKDDPRYALGIPRTDNANYLWIQDFYSALNPTGRAGFVMANSAADARQSELDIRQKLIKNGHVDVVVAISSNFFYTVTLPVTLWFLDKGKPSSQPSPSGGRRTELSSQPSPSGGRGTEVRRADTVLFIDARNIYRQIDRAHRDFTDEQIDFLHYIVRAYRGESIGSDADGNELFAKEFPEGRYLDIKGLCKVATIEEIEAQGWSLNPGRYVGVAEEDDDGIDFKVRLEELHEELEVLNSEARELEKRIGKNISELLG